MRQTVKSFSLIRIALALSLNLGSPLPWERRKKAPSIKSRFLIHSHFSMETFMLAPSILAADFSNVSQALRQIEEGGGRAVHIDVMDGHFVPPITFGEPVISTVRKCTALPFDVHLMVERPETQLERFAEAGADWLTFHVEATNHADLCVQRIKALGKKAGVALCPATPVSALAHLLPLVDLVLVMTVNPGWGGQHMIPYTVGKVSELRAARERLGCSFRVSVDGGVNASTLSTVLDAGADVVVSGSSFFRGELKWNGA